MNTTKTKASKLRAKDICVVTPTKGRLKQLERLLTTLSHQSTPVGQVIIADGGGDAASLVISFADKLPVIWLKCPEPGQIIQRNFALQHVSPSARVVIYFDDDIQLEPNAVEILVAFWNAQYTQPAGVSFNLLNMPKQPDSLFRRMFFMATEPRGRVWRSGYNTPIVDIDDDLESEWLIGGATAWRRDILDTYKIPNLPSTWAICEDLIFSYPIAKKERLLVCSEARVRHIDDAINPTFSKAKTRGKSAVMWRYYFISNHPEFSKPMFFWMNAGQVLGRTLRFLLGRRGELGHMIGTISGMAVCARAAIFSRDIRDELR